MTSERPLLVKLDLAGLFWCVPSVNVLGLGLVWLGFMVVMVCVHIAAVESLRRDPS